MRSLAKWHTRSGRMGTPLPEPFISFGTHKAVFRRGGTSLIAGQPGSYKSVMALNMLATWLRAGQTALFFSADSDEYTVARRMAGILSGRDTETIEAMFRDRKLDELTGLLSDVNNARFEYRALDIEAITDRVNAWEDVHGDYPDVIFIDNLINFAPSSNDWGSMIDLQNDLDALARAKSAHVCILHHVTDGFPFGQPVPRYAIQGKVTQIPRLVLTVAAVQMKLMVAVVKNTNGPQFPDAAKWMNFSVEPSLRIVDEEYEGTMG